MSNDALMSRSGGVCELCGGTDALEAEGPLGAEILTCAVCRAADENDPH